MSTERLSDTINDGDSPIYYNEAFHSMMESHILDLTMGSGARVHAIDRALANQYEGDFFGLLVTLGVPDQYHWITMRCNNLYSPMGYKSTTLNVIIPYPDDIDELYAIYTMSTGVSMG